MLYVKNTNSFVFRARFDGIDYSFPINEKVPVDREAAKHIFGFGSDDKAEVMVRHGWCLSSDRIEDGQRILNKFVFSEDEPLPTDVQKDDLKDIPTFAARKKTGTG